VERELAARNPTLRAIINELSHEPLTFVVPATSDENSDSQRSPAGIPAAHGSVRQRFSRAGARERCGWCRYGGKAAGEGCRDRRGAWGRKMSGCGTGRYSRSLVRYLDNIYFSVSCRFRGRDSRYAQLSQYLDPALISTLPHYGLRYGSAPATGNFPRLGGRPPLVSPLKSCRAVLSRQCPRSRAHVRSRFICGRVCFSRHS
jgi:hypothetical protein